MALWHLFLSDLLDAVFPAADSVPSDRNHQEELPALHPEAKMPKDRVQGVSIAWGEPCRLNYSVSWDTPGQPRETRRRAQGFDQVSFPDPAGTGDGHVLVIDDPLIGEKRLEQREGSEDSGSRGPRGRRFVGDWQP